MADRFLTALPVYNEVAHVEGVVAEVLRYGPDVLLVDDGSTDGTSAILDRLPGVQVVHHSQNRGYGAALKTAFDYAAEHHYPWLVTIDCDGQHEPQRIPLFVAAGAHVDIVSGTRYLKHFADDSPPPPDRRRINWQVSQELNRRLGLHLTDAFCGFKAYRVSALKRLNITEPGYAMPLQLWVQAAAAGLRILELPVPRIYLDDNRSFGAGLDHATTRLEYYHLVIDRSLAELGAPPEGIWSGVLCGDRAG